MTPAQAHKRWSILKSALRFAGCFAVLAGGSFMAFAGWFALAEVAGIVEEIVV